MKTYKVVAVRTVTFTIEATSREAAEELALQCCEEDDFISVTPEYQDWQVSVCETERTKSETK